MGLHLIAYWATDLSFWWNVVQVALGLGFVIFVHELGHFAVAKMCGVKCEKFYLGFDIGGLKLCKFRWGETEYGIGILPLGGYVKMLGQDDNPAKAAEEMERAKLHAQEGTVTPEDAAVLDPRSYMAQSVPERMAIISAGVIMNVIFAFIFTMIAYGLGVQYQPAVVGSLGAGDEAWRVGVQPDDEIVRIGKIENPRFQDLMVAVVLGNIRDGLEMQVRRPGEERTQSFKLLPKRKGLAPRIGVTAPSLLKLHPDVPVLDVSSAAEQFRGGDKIVLVDGQQVTSFPQVQSVLARRPDDSVTIEVERAGAQETDPKTTAVIKLPPVPMRRVGFTMTMGAVTAVRSGSPADKAGIKAGDVLERIDGEALVDPMFLGEWLRRRVGQPIDITVRRDGVAEPIELRGIELIEPTGAVQVADGSPAVAEPLGIAYSVTNTVAAVDATGPAADKIKPGDVLAKVTLVPPESEEQKPAERRQHELSLELNEKYQSWPLMFSLLQDRTPGTSLRLEFAGKTEPVDLTPVTADDWNSPDRGLNPQSVVLIQQATSVPEAARLAARQTKDFMLQVYMFIRRIWTGQVSIRGAGGPISIAKAAFYQADAGFSQLLMFLAMLSANLAVINFLPIPVLDGGHMVFLIYEGIRRKPPSERFVVALSYAGLFLILSLMLFVFALDLGFIERR